MSDADRPKPDRAPTRRRASMSRRARQKVESGGFGPSSNPPGGKRVGAGHTGPGRSGAPPTAEIDAAQQLLMANLGYEFSAKEPLAAALTHRSWRNERSEVTLDNQRIEFLGDLVLGLAIGDILLLRLPDSKEGEVSVLKAHLVRQSTLAEVAKRLGVGPALRLGKGEERNGGRKRPAVLADAMEAVFAAVFIDGGYEPARDVIGRALAQPLEELLATTAHVAFDASDASMALHASTRNYKTALQEWLAAAGAEPPEYLLDRRLGPAHDRRFRVRVEATVANVAHEAMGEGRTVKAAENDAAAQLYGQLTNPPPA